MDIEPIFGQASLAFQRGGFAEAERLFRRIIETQPGHAGALHYLGVCCYRRGDYVAAVTYIGAALDSDPESPFAHGNLGLALKRLHRLEEAVTCFDRAIALSADIPAFYNNRGLVHAEMRRLDAAQADFGRAIELDPNMAEAYSNRGKTLTELGHFDAALRHIDQALALRPDFAEAYSNRAAVYRETGRFTEAMENCKRALAIQPDFPNSLGYWLHDMLNACAWDDLDLARGRVLAAIEADRPAADPFVVLAMPATAAQQQRCARRHGRDRLPAGLTPFWQGERHARERLRIGYFSADFHNHATAHLIAELFERHDRARFEVIGFSYGPQRRDAWRRRIENGVDRLVECAPLSDREIAALARRLEIDIAVDLKGYTRDARPGIFALRPAPIQVNYLGYPGTMGTACMDYIIADHTVIQASDEAAYDEKVVYLPHCYQANDTTKPISTQPSSRAEHGLPEHGFVYCCFNNNYKISPEVFDIWMRVLAANPTSVLWLFESNPVAADNLRREAAKRGVAPTRLVFAARRELADHLARHRLADLFLDTFYYNAHTTASDALWAGLPVLTRIGDTFASRVAASLSRALDLPELIARTDAEYESLALSLASEPARLAEIRTKLIRHRETRPPFDARAFGADIETAYLAMWERHCAGLPPARIVVTGLEPSVRSSHGESVD